MRKTSIETFRKLLAARCLGNSYKTVLENLVRCRGLTAQELCHKAGREGLWKRLSELRDMALIEEVGVRKCSVSGQPALTWRLARKLPSRKGKPVDKKKKWFIVWAANSKQATAFKDLRKAQLCASARDHFLTEAVECKKRVVD